MNERIGRQNFFLTFTLPIVFLILTCSGIGILNPHLYQKETADWLAQCVGQDFSNIFLVAPALLISSIFSARGNRIAKIIWAGTMITNIYSYVLYCFDVPLLLHHTRSVDLFLSDFLRQAFQP